MPALLRLVLLTVLPAFAQTEAEFEARSKALAERAGRECPENKQTPSCDRLRLELREAETNLRATRTGPKPGVEVRGHEDVTVAESAPPASLLPMSRLLQPYSGAKPGDGAKSAAPAAGPGAPPASPGSEPAPETGAHVCFEYRKAANASAVREGLRKVPAEDRGLASYGPLAAGLSYSCENAVAGQQGTQMYRENCELGSLRKKVDSFCMERRNRRTARAKQEYEKVQKQVDGLVQGQTDPAAGFVGKDAGHAFGEFIEEFALDIRGGDLPAGKANEIRGFARALDIVVDSYLLAFTGRDIAQAAFDWRCGWPEPADRDKAACVRRLLGSWSRRAPGAPASAGKPGAGMSPSAKAAVVGGAAGFAAGAMAGRLGGGRDSEDRCEDSKANLDSCLKDKGSKASCCKYVRGKGCKKKLGC